MGRGKGEDPFFSYPTLSGQNRTLRNERVSLSPPLLLNVQCRFARFIETVGIFVEKLLLKISLTNRDKRWRRKRRDCIQKEEEERWRESYCSVLYFTILYCISPLSFEKQRHLHRML